MSTAPALATDEAGLPAMPSVSDLAKSPNMALAIWFNDALFERVKTIATYISRAEGFTPGHLIGKPEACFAVVTRALTWRLDPFAVAQCTYQPAQGAKVGYEGKLVQAILENSGHLEGGVTYEHFGDWSKVTGKFTKKTSERGKEYAVAAWNPKDEEGLGVIVRAKIKGENAPREFKFLLTQAFPRNSVSWALDPMTQICYLAVRRFASVRTPGLLMGVPFDREDETPQMVDVTPARPSRADYMASTATVIDAEPEQDPFVFTDADGEVSEISKPEQFVQALSEALGKETDERRIEVLWEENSGQLNRIEASIAQAARDAYDLAVDRAHLAKHPPQDTDPAADNAAEDMAIAIDALIEEMGAAKTVSDVEAICQPHRDMLGKAHKSAPAAYKRWLAVYNQKTGRA